MLSAGQYVNTKYGRGVIVSAGGANQHVYVRIDSSSQIYVLDRAAVFEAGPLLSEGVTIHQLSETDGANGGDPRRARAETDPSIPNTLTKYWRGPMKRGQRKRGRPVEESQLSVFVRARLADLGMKQSDFCRLTGFDQGLLSKIQSSMISKLNLETALRLAVGLSVSPRRIFALIGKPEFHTLLTKAYPIELSQHEPGDSHDVLADVIKVSRLALEAHGLKRDLTPVMEMLKQEIAAEPEIESNEPDDEQQQFKISGASRSESTAASQEEQTAVAGEAHAASEKSASADEYGFDEEHGGEPDEHEIPIEGPSVPPREQGTPMHERSYGKHNSH